MTPPVILAIGGSDSGGGAGLQADVKTIHFHGGYATTVVTAVTAQNTVAVLETFDVPVGMVRRQLDAVLEDFPVVAIKTGMLPTAEIAHTVCDAIATADVRDVVVDPIMLAGTGAPLADPDAVVAMRDRLLPLARVVTPNRAEVAALSGMAVYGRDDLIAAAARLREMTGVEAVAAKGGHLDGDDVLDVLAMADDPVELVHPRIAAPDHHGTGCTFASTLATRIAHGDDLQTAFGIACDHTARALRGGLDLGEGAGPVDVRATSDRGA